MSEKNNNLLYVSIAIIFIIIAIFIWFITKKKEEEEEEYELIDPEDPPDIIYGDGVIHGFDLIPPPIPIDPMDPCANIPPGMGVARRNPDTGRIEIIQCP